MSDTREHPARYRSSHTLLGASVCVALLGCVLAWAADRKPADPPRAPGAKAAMNVDNPFPNRKPAPSLDGGSEWLNTSNPLTLKELRGKVVLLDFWTYCCINCMHILPDLKYLEQKYAKELVVIGVHSAKFDNEKDADNIRRAIMRYEIEHPVVNDADMTIWRKFDVHAWPTFVLIDPEGQVLGHASSEGQRELLDQVIGQVVAYYRAKGTLDESPVRFDLERAKTPDTPLRFPGKIFADKAGQRLFIADSNHNRIVVTNSTGELLAVIGSGAIGRADGSYSDCTFDHPQGLALVDQTLYVADTENHLLRAVDLERQTVRTVAGTGEQAQGRGAGGPPRETALNSPWDLCFAGGKLNIAMAGPHQIWQFDPKLDVIGPYAGSGREDIRNGPLASAAFAQPSGLATDGKFLYVADSEGSAIRRVPLDSAGSVTTLAGTSDLSRGRSLFEFGDRDGRGDKARLQHPLGVAFKDGRLYIADTYNHKIKVLSLNGAMNGGIVESWLGDGQRGDGDDPPRFSEPAGLSFLGGTLYIADTNNHRIRVVNLGDNQVHTFEIKGLTAPAPPTTETPATDHASAQAVRVDARQVSAPGPVKVLISLELPDGYKLNPEAPLVYRVRSNTEPPLIEPKALNKREEVAHPLDDQPITLSLPLVENASGRAEWHLTLTYGYCRDGAGGLCKLGTAAWLIPVEVSEGGRESIELTAAPK